MVKRKWYQPKEYANIVNLRNDAVNYQLHQPYGLQVEHRLRKCSAHYFRIGRIIWLRSYNTIVACYDTIDDVLYVYGRFSITTWQHIAKFSRDFCTTMTKEIDILCEDWF